MKTAALVLAAGASRRMGTNKLLLQIDGEPLVRRTVRRVLAAGLSPVTVVVGPDAEEVRASLRDLACEFAVSPDPTLPTSTSLHRGVEAVPPDADGALVVLADMVNVTAEMLSRVAAAGGRDGALMVASRYASVVAPPAWFHRSLFPDLLAFTGEGTVRAMVRRHPESSVLVDWPAEALLDLDTPEDLERFGLDAALTRRP